MTVFLACIDRVLEDETNPLEGVSFALPPDAFTSRPVASPDPKYRGGAAADAGPGAAADSRAAPGGVHSLEEMLQASGPGPQAGTSQNPQVHSSQTFCSNSVPLDVADCTMALAT